MGTVMAGKPCRHADRHPRWDRRPRTARLEQGRDVPVRGRSQRQAVTQEGGGLSRLLARPLLAMGGALDRIPWMQAFPAHAIFFPLIGLDGGDPFFIY